MSSLPIGVVFSAGFCMPCAEVFVFLEEVLDFGRGSHLGLSGYLHNIEVFQSSKY